MAVTGPLGTACIPPSVACVLPLIVSRISRVPISLQTDSGVAEPEDEVEVADELVEGGTIAGSEKVARICLRWLIIKPKSASANKSRYCD